MTNRATPKQATSMFPHIPTPSTIYTVRLADTETAFALARRLRRVVAAGGAAWTLDLLDGGGFMFAMPTHTPNPLTGYLHAGLLEEGCVLVRQTTLGEERGRRVFLGGSSTESEGSESESEGESESERSEAEHPALRVRFAWTELGR